MCRAAFAASRGPSISAVPTRRFPASASAQRAARLGGRAAFRVGAPRERRPRPVRRAFRSRPRASCARRDVRCAVVSVSQDGLFPFAPAALAEASCISTWRPSSSTSWSCCSSSRLPLSVFLMQSKRKVARLAAFALMFIAVVYVGGFEHYRLHRPEVTRGGLKRALVPTVVLELIESEFQLRYLPIAADPADVAAARAAIAPPDSDADPFRDESAFPSGRKLVPGARDDSPRIAKRHGRDQSPRSRPRPRWTPRANPSWSTFPTAAPVTRSSATSSTT